MFSSIVQALIRIADAIAKLVLEAQKANAKLERIADSQQKLAATQQQLVDLVSRLFPGPIAGIRLVFNVKGVAMGDSITVPDDETTLRSSATPVDTEGHPTTTDTPPTYESSDETVLTITAADDGLSATYDVGAPGDAIITVHSGIFDADNNEIVGKGFVHVTPGKVATFAVNLETDSQPSG